MNSHIGVNINESRIFDWMESGGARNGPTDSQAVLVLCYLSYFSLIWSLLVEPAEDSSRVLRLGTRFSSSCSFRSGYKRKSKNMKKLSDRWQLQQKEHQEFKTLDYCFTHICFNVVHSDELTIFQAPWKWWTSAVNQDNTHNIMTKSWFISITKAGRSKQAPLSSSLGESSSFHFINLHVRPELI